MIFTETPLSGAFVIDIERRQDERGFFARTWCQREFDRHGLVGDLRQANVSHNHRKATVRGMHYQVAPCQEAKLVRCGRGAIWDVIVDLRRESPTYLNWFGIELTADNRRQLYVPRDFAHGYQTLVDETEVYYAVSDFYAPQSERGIRWNDPQIAIDWPLNAALTISSKDRSWPDFKPERTLSRVGTPAISEDALE
jgi:dTDP-4-dehydrorhamnose 3,5-epimerase